MLDYMDYAKTARKHRKHVLFDSSDKQSFLVNYEQEEIEKILAHREPFLLVDSIKAINLASRTILGQRLVREDDPVFCGHFPSTPIYPGVLHIEMIGQLGVCLHHFLTKNSILLEPAQAKINVRLVKILHVLFQYEVYPGDELMIACKELYTDEYISKGIGQIIKNDQVCTVSIAEMYKF
jgi:3-hydroxyacyl-[acyl-carrier-protein] dehydratase